MGGYIRYETASSNRRAAKFKRELQRDRDAAQAKKLKTAGYSNAAIADQLICSENTVRIMLESN